MPGQMSVHANSTDPFDIICDEAVSVAKTRMESDLLRYCVHDSRPKKRPRSEGNPRVLPERPVGNDNGFDGTMQMRELARLLDCFVKQRSETQKRLHRCMMATVLRHVFRKDKDSELRACMREHGLQKTKQQFMAITPRRFGKTYSVAMFAAACIMACPETEIAIFSTAKRASGLLLKQIRAFIEVIPGGRARIASCNAEVLVVSHGEHSSKVSSFPSCART